MCGDTLEGGLATPEDYARFAEKLVKRGYKAIKLHTWMPPVSFAPDPKMDVKACAAVREAVGPDIDLMLDGFHWYSRTDALYLGRALEKLDFAWFEEMMDEQSIASYAWLAGQLDIPVIGPEIDVRQASHPCGLGDGRRLRHSSGRGAGRRRHRPDVEVERICRIFGMDCEVHGNGAANLMVTAIQELPLV